MAYDDAAAFTTLFNIVNPRADVSCLSSAIKNVIIILYWILFDCILTSHADVSGFDLHVLYTVKVLIVINIIHRLRTARPSIQLQVDCFNIGNSLF